jgi:hypothetical protein
MILQVTMANQEHILFGMVNPFTSQLVLISNSSFDAFDSIEVKIKGLALERLRRAADSEGQARRYVIYEKQPEEKEKKKKVKNFIA